MHVLWHSPTRTCCVRVESIPLRLFSTTCPDGRRASSAYCGRPGGRRCGAWLMLLQGDLGYRGRSAIHFADHQKLQSFALCKDEQVRLRTSVGCVRGFQALTDIAAMSYLDRARAPPSRRRSRMLQGSWSPAAGRRRRQVSHKRFAPYCRVHNRGCLSRLGEVAVDLAIKGC